MIKKNSKNQKARKKTDNRKSGKKRNFFQCPFNRFSSTLIIFLVAIIGSVFWLTGAEGNDLSSPKAYVAELKNKSLIKKVNSEEWVPIKNGIEVIEGDKIKTESEGEVTIIFYDNSIVHVDSDTELTIKKASIDQENYTNDSINLKVDSGRVWSRILQLMDKSSSFQVESSNTVATVRGTAFDFHVTPEKNTEVSVVENEIEVMVFQEEEGKERKVIKKAFLAEETETIIPKKWISENDIEINETTKEKTESEWFDDNFKKDEKYEEEIFNKKRKELRKTAKILPGSKLYKANKGKEGLMLLAAKSSPKKFHALIADLTKTRLAEVQILVDNRKIESAKNALSEAEKLLTRYQEEIKKEEFKKFRYQIKNQIELQQRLMSKATTEDEAFEIKKRLEELEAVLVLKEDKDQFFSRIRHLENRLEEDQLLRIEGRGRLCSNLDKYEQEWRKMQNDSREGMERRVEFVKFKIDNFRERYCQKTRTIVTRKIIKKVPAKSSHKGNDDELVYKTREVVVEKEDDNEPSTTHGTEKYPVNTSNNKKPWEDASVSREEFLKNTQSK